MTEKATLNFQSWVGLPAPAVDPNHAVRKQEVDEEISSLQAQIDNLQVSSTKTRLITTLTDLTFRETRRIYHDIQSLNYGVDIWFLKYGKQTSMADDENNIMKTVLQVVKIERNIGSCDLTHIPNSGFETIDLVVCIWEY